MLNDLLRISIVSALEAGGAIMDIYNNPNVDFEVEFKSDQSPLTIADKKSNVIIEQHLSLTPHPILSEEGRSIDYNERKGWQQLWIVDPLDGTKEFVKRNGEFTVNIALVYGDTPVLGVVYLPVLQILYFAHKDIGSYKIELSTPHSSVDTILTTATKLPIASLQQGRNFRVLASRSHLDQQTIQYISKLKLLHPNLEIVNYGSSIKICMVAEGSADIYPRFAPTMEWDTAAANAIAIYSGKKIVHADELTPISYNKRNLLNPNFIVK